MNATELKDLRVKMGMKQAAMARALGISRSQYIRYENGTQTISKTVALLAGMIAAKL